TVMEYETLGRVATWCSLALAWVVCARTAHERRVGPGRGMLGAPIRPGESDRRRGIHGVGWRGSQKVHVQPEPGITTELSHPTRVKGTTAAQEDNCRSGKESHNFREVCMFCRCVPGSFSVPARPTVPQNRAEVSLRRAADTRGSPGGNMSNSPSRRVRTRSRSSSLVRLMVSMRRSKASSNL